MEAVPTVHVAERVYKPQVGFFGLVLEHHVHPLGEAALDDEVLAERLGNVLVVDVVGEEFVAVGVGQLREAFVVPFHVQVEALGEVVLETGNHVLCALEGIFDFADGTVGLQEFVLEVFGAREETVEQVDHVAVRVGGNQVLGVDAGCCLEAEDLVDLVLDAQAGLGRKLGQGSVVLRAERRLDDQVALLVLVAHVNAHLGGVLDLLHLHAQCVEGLEIGAATHGLDAVLEFALPQQVLEVQAKVEAVDLAEALRQSLFHQLYAVVRYREVTVDQHRRARRHHHKVESSTGVVPVEVRNGLVIHLVREVEPEHIEARTRRTGKRNLAVDVLVLEGQSLVVYVVVEDFGGLVQVRLLA